MIRVSKLKIKVYAPPFLHGDDIDENGWLEVTEGTTLKDLYKVLKVPVILRPVIICSVNYAKPEKNQLLKAGDIVSIYYPVAGG